MTARTPCAEDVRAAAWPLLVGIGRGLAGLDDAQVAAMFARMQPRPVTAGELVVEPGGVSDDVAFIVRGCFRMFFLERDGSEHTAQIFTEGTFVGDYESFLLRTPADRWVQALEDGMLLLLSRQDQHALYASHVAFERFGRRLAEELYVVSARRYASFLRFDARARYEELVRARPELLQRVPQYVLASYLGVTPETLSRIRARRGRS